MENGNSMEFFCSTPEFRSMSGQLRDTKFSHLGEAPVREANRAPGQTEVEAMRAAVDRYVRENEPRLSTKNRHARVEAIVAVLIVVASIFAMLT